MRASTLTSTILGLCALPAAFAQTPSTPPPGTLPASAPTSLASPPASSPSPARPYSAAVPANSPPATITWQGNRLTVVSGGAALSDTLRQISLTTGLRIRGVPSTDPIYGTYGPGTLDDVVDSLLTGLPVNMLIDHTGGTSTLTLTPRLGRASAPAPNVAQQPDPDSEISRRPASLPDRNRYQQAAQANPQTSAPGSVEPEDLQPSPTQPRATTAPLPASPNGVKTPEQIQGDLLRLQRQGPVPPQQQGAPVQP